MRQFLVFASFLALGIASPDATPDAEADADAFYGQYQWPGVGGYGFSSTCYGCRPYGYYYGKRSAEPHGAGVAVHPGLATSYRGPTVFGYPGAIHYGKRSAEPHGTGVAVHPGLATSFNGPTVYGYPSIYGKRSAEPHGVAVHPYGVSHVGPTVFGYPSYYYGKRSAEPQHVVPETGFAPSFGGYGKRSAEPHGLGVHPGHATSYVGRTIWGYPSVYGKRAAEAAPTAEADADAYYGYYPAAYGGYGYGWPGGYTSVTGLYGRYWG